jgi:hypothetical protein
MQMFTCQKHLMRFDHLHQNIIRHRDLKKILKLLLGQTIVDIDKLVMAIGSLTTTINESCESELKFCKDE